MFERIEHDPPGTPLSGGIDLQADTQQASGKHRKVDQLVSEKYHNSIYGKGKYKGKGKEAAIVPKSREYGAVRDYDNSLGQSRIGYEYTVDPETEEFKAIRPYLPTGEGIADVLDNEGNFLQKDGGRKPAQPEIAKEASTFIPPPADFIPPQGMMPQPQVQSPATPQAPQSYGSGVSVSSLFHNMMQQEIPSQEHLQDYVPPKESLPEVSVAFETIVGTIRGTYVEVLEQDKYVILMFDAERETHFTPAVNDESPLKLSGGDVEATVYFVGIEFTIPSLNRGVQVYIKE